jgi:hypothetical protein
MITLARTGTSALYQPQQGYKGDRLAFLAAAAGATIALADCWASRGSPRVAGYFVMMDRQATALEAQAVEKLLFSESEGPKLPPQPKANGLVWLRLGDGTSPVVVAVATADFDRDDAPIVAEDTVITDIPRLLGFGEGAPIKGTAGQDGDWLSLTVYAPRIAAEHLQPPSAPSHGPAIDVNLSLADAGQLTFRGLAESFQRPRSGEVTKNLVKVLVDPVSPFNSGATYTGLSYVMIEDSDGIHLRAAG